MWFQAIAQLVGQEAATPNVNVANPYLAQENSPTSLLVVAGVLVLAGGAAYFLLRTPPRAMGRRSRR